jgi:hypothetical protein
MIGSSPSLKTATKRQATHRNGIVARALRPARALPGRDRACFANEAQCWGRASCYGRGLENPKTRKERRLGMSKINWEKDFQKAVESAAKNRKPIFQDFWFDG